MASFSPENWTHVPPGTDGGRWTMLIKVTEFSKSSGDVVIHHFDGSHHTALFFNGYNILVDSPNHGTLYSFNGSYNDAFSFNRYSKITLTAGRDYDYASHNTALPLVKTFNLDSKVELFPNGYDEMTEGFVSIVISAQNQLSKAKLLCAENVELSCVIAVVDAEGRRRFPRSFSEEWHKFRNLEIDDYILRSTLLGEATELLPNDTLTISLDIEFKFDYIEHHRRSIGICFPDELASADFETETVDSASWTYLDLDSPFGKRLVEDSLYFSSMLDTSMVEITESSRRMLVPNEELDSFNIIAGILCVPDQMPLYLSPEEIFDVYVTANKYIMNSVKDTSRFLLKLCLSDENNDSIKELADSHNDDQLKKSIEDFSRLKDDDLLICEEFPYNEAWRKISPKLWQTKYQIKQFREERFKTLVAVIPLALVAFYSLCQPKPKKDQSDFSYFS